MRRSVWLWVLAFGCTAEEGDLVDTWLPDAGAPVAADAGGGAGAADAGVGAVDAGLPSGPCDGFDALPATNRRELLRLGFSLADTVLEAEVSAPAAGDGRRLAPAVIARVHRGHAFLEATRALVEIDPATAARGTFPRRLLIGLVEPGLPVAREDGAPELGRVVIVAEASERGLVEDLLDYRIGDELPFIAGVRFGGVVDDRITAEVIEPISGEVPDRLVFNWRGPYTFEPPTGQHIVTLGFPPTRLPDGQWLASTADVRPYTTEARAAVQDALRNRRPGLDGPALMEARDRYADSWRFHRAPRVVVGEVDGLAGECCTGAGGTYVSYAVQDDLRGDADAPRFVRGGHGYYSEEACGERRILGLDPLVASAPVSAFACAPTTESLETGLPVPQVHVERADSAEARAEVQAWLDAPEPHYRLLGERGAFAGAPSDGPWSAPRSVTEALAFGQLVRIRVAEELNRENGEIEVVLETPFATDFFDHLEVRRVRLAYTCGDPRLRQVGAEYWAPLFGAVDYDAPDGGAAEGGLFLVPGVLFEPDGWAERLQARVQRVTGRR